MYWGTGLLEFMWTYRRTWSLCYVLLFCLMWSGSQAQDTDLLQEQHLIRHERSEPCKVNCTAVKLRPVCGSDGRTYMSKCEIRRLKRCEGKDVEINHKGRCKGFSKCRQDRLLAEEESRRSSEPIFVPKCKKDGTYAEVQCHAATGSCWCADSDGKHIPRSAVLGKKINCRHSKGNSKRRRPSISDRNSSGCSQSDRAKFNTNLIALFTEEYAQIPKPAPPTYPGAPKDLPIRSESDSILDTPEKRVIEWKFSELDSDKDNTLKKKEIKSLKRMVKKFVKPKACARNFDKYCDLDRDKAIARTEWSVCLGVDINNEHLTTTESPGLSSRPAGRGIPLINSEARPASVLLRSFADAVDSTKKPKTTDKLPINPGISKEEDVDNKVDRWFPSVVHRRNCDEERKIAIDKNKNEPQGHNFIPECISGGKFRQEQCHNNICWCVDETSGQPIRGILTTHGDMPDCANQTVRQFKGRQGCPYFQKKEFLTELLDQLTIQMTEMANNQSLMSSMPEPNAEHSLEERVARWKLHVLDKNKNTILERRELKSFKNIELRKQKSLRKCGRNFVRYCDADNDKRITTDEWIDCLGVKVPDSDRRTGTNPFIDILQPN